mgnify:FL=1
MELISPDRTKLGAFPGYRAASGKIYSSFSRNSPCSAGISFSFSSCLQTGCVISPVPISVIPFFLAHRSSISTVPSLLVAMENLEWMCKSAICFKIFPPVFFSKASVNLLHIIIISYIQYVYPFLNKKKLCFHSPFYFDFYTVICLNDISFNPLVLYF